MKKGLMLVLAVMLACGFGRSLFAIEWDWLSPVPKGSIRDTWVSSTGKLYAVGSYGMKGIIQQYDGSNWHLMTNPDTTCRGLSGIWGSSDSNLYAVGTDGNVLRYDSKKWNTVNPSIMRGELLIKIWGSGSSNIFVITQYGKVFRYNGQSWYLLAQNPLGKNQFLHIWGYNSSNVFVAGWGFILKWNGYSWSLSLDNYPGAFFGIWGSSASNIYATCTKEDIGFPYSIILRYNGASWSEVDQSAYDPYQLLSDAIWGSGASNIYFGVYQENSILHWNGAGFDTINLAYYPSSIIDISGYGSKNVWYSTWAPLYSSFIHYDGSAITEIDPGIPDRVEIAGLWGADPKNMFAIGVDRENMDLNYNQIYRFNGSRWLQDYNELQYNDVLYDIWGSSATDVFVVGDYKIFHYNGTYWNEYFPKAATNLKSIWGYDANHVYAAGQSGMIMQYNGTSWTYMPTNTSGGDDLVGIWGNDSTHIYTVAANGIVYEYNGVSWETMTNLNRPARSIWGSGLSDIYVVGDNGVIFRFNGNFWSLQTSPTTVNLNRVWGTGSSNVFAAGNNGVLIHYNGTSWHVDKTETSGIELSSIWGASETKVFVVGKEGTILKSYIPVWQTGIIFKKGDYVTYNAKTWKCLKDHTSSLYNSPGSSGGAVYWKS